MVQKAKTENRTRTPWLPRRLSALLCFNFLPVHLCPCAPPSRDLYDELISAVTQLMSSDSSIRSTAVCVCVSSVSPREKSSCKVWSDTSGSGAETYLELIRPAAVHKARIDLVMLGNGTIRKQEVWTPVAVVVQAATAFVTSPAEIYLFCNCELETATWSRRLWFAVVETNVSLKKNLLKFF